MSTRTRLLIYDPIDSGLPGPLHYPMCLGGNARCEHPFGGAYVHVVRGSSRTFWEMEHLMAEALFLIMAVSLGTISYVVAHELAKRNR